MEPKPNYIGVARNDSAGCPVDRGSIEPTDLMYCLKKSREWAPGVDGDKTFCDWCEVRIILKKLRK